LRMRTIGFIGFVGLMIVLGLFVSNVFLLLGMGSLCGGHMLLHGNDHKHETASVKDDEKAKTACH